VLKNFLPHKLPENRIFVKLCVNHTTSRHNFWPEWPAEHKFWRNKNVGKFARIKTSLYDTKNAKKLFQKDVINGLSVKIAIKSNIVYFPNQRWRRVFYGPKLLMNTSLRIRTCILQTIWFSKKIKSSKRVGKFFLLLLLNATEIYLLKRLFSDENKRALSTKTFIYH